MADSSAPSFSSTKAASSVPSSSVIDVPFSPRKYSPSFSNFAPFDSLLDEAEEDFPLSIGKLRVVWIRSNCLDDPIENMVKRAFQRFQVDDSSVGLIQLWAPVKMYGREFLTTTHQPFAIATLDKVVQKYRFFSMEYQYNVDVTDKFEVSWVISDGSPSRTFLNQTPELFPDLNAQPINPLVSLALECGLMSSVVLPVFDPTKSRCVGVVECSMSSSTQLLYVFNELNTVLEQEGLKTFDAREFLPYSTIHDLKPAKDEIDEALNIILQSHHLAFAHVWIAYEDENLSSLEDGQAKQILGLKLTDHFVNLGNEDFECREKYLEDCNNACYRLPFEMDEVFVGKTFQKYSDACYRFPLIMGEGFIGETLKSYKPYFVKDISKLSDTESVLSLLSISMDYSCFVIYLRSTKTGDLDYVFEFLWSQGREKVILLESLLLTLKRHLPSFKIASGTKLGDEIDILDVENSADSENKYFKILQRNAISQKGGRRSKDEKCSTPLKAKGKTMPIILSQEFIVSEFAQTHKETAQNLKVSSSKWKLVRNTLAIMTMLRRKDYVQYGTNEKKDKGGADQDDIKETSLDEKTVTIKAEYADDVIMFTLPISSATFADIWKEIGKNFKLDPASHYKIKCYDEEDNEWILFTCDEDATLFTKNKRIVQLRLLQGQISDPFHFFQLT